MFSANHFLSFADFWRSSLTSFRRLNYRSLPLQHRHLGPERFALLGFSFAKIAQAKSGRLLRGAKIRPDNANRGTA
jgi:hypothetical protein